MTVHVILVAGQSNVGTHALADLPTYMRPASAYGQTYIWNGDGPYWGVLNPGTNTGSPSSPASWGLETPLAYNIRAHIPAEDVLLIIKSMKGETGAWENPLGIDWSPNSAGEMFDLTASRVASAKAAMAALGIDATPRSVVWTQGETDALAGRTQAQYTTDLWTLLNEGDSAWAAGTSTEWIINGVRKDLGPSAIDIARAQSSVASVDSSVLYVCTHSFQTLDSIHYTPQSTLALGAADASAWFLL